MKFENRKYVSDKSILNQSRIPSVNVFSFKFKFTFLCEGLMDSSFIILKLFLRGMTYEAQAALRRVMEQYCKVTRFCIVCNYVSKIIEPLTSRCAKFRFQPVSDEAHSGKLQTIMQAEGINPAQGVMDALLYCAQGDLRKSITLLQSVHTFDDQVSAQRILDIAGDIPPQVLDKYVF